MMWDPTVLQFDRTQNFGLPGLTDAQFGTMQTGSGILTFAWIDNAAQGVTLADGTIAFEVCFDVIGDGGSSSTINFVDTPTQIEVVRAGSGTVPLDPTGGSISIPIIIDSCPDPISVQPETIGSSCAAVSYTHLTLPTNREV